MYWTEYCCCLAYALYLPEVVVVLSALSGVVLWVWFGVVAHEFMVARSKKSGREVA